MDPNSQNQVWSQWIFTVHDGGRICPRRDVEYNAARWLRRGFGSVATCRVSRTRDGWLIMARVEGAPADDRRYVDSVAKEFARKFVAGGWGPMAWGDVRARVIAGPARGRPRAQWVSIPTIRLGE